MPYLENGTYYADNTDRPAVGSMAATTLLNDIAVDNTSTGPTEASDFVSFTGDPCGEVYDVQSYQTMAWYGGGLYEFTAMRMNGRCRYPTDGILSQCNLPDEDGFSTFTSESDIEYTTDVLGATGWTLLQHNTMLDGNFQIVTWNGTIEARWLRRVLSANRENHGVGNNVGGGYYAKAQNTDWRIEGSLISSDNPPTPTPTPDDPGGGGGLPGGDNGWSVTPIPDTPPWDRVCGEGESGWNRSNTR